MSTPHATKMRKPRHERTRATERRNFRLPQAVFALFFVSSSFLLSACAAPFAPPATTDAGADAFRNPVIASDFPDPGILVEGGTIYAFATNGYGQHVQVAISHDLAHWTRLPDALPELPTWADPDGEYVWAPEVVHLGAIYLMYYTARDRATHRQCIGLATSTAPTGPYADDHTMPFLCQLRLGGTIDPSPLWDSTTLYLYFKNDGNCCGQPTQIWVSRLTSDGQHLQGEPIPLLRNDQPWEGAVVEAPNMIAHNGWYDLFYSANAYTSAAYAIGFAQCLTPMGPCHKTSNTPLFQSDFTIDNPRYGPGGQSIFTFEGQTWIAYHTWEVTASGQRGQQRDLHLARLNWLGDAPVISSP